MSNQGEGLAVCNTDLVSVVIPMYNVAPYVEKCVKSVLGSVYRNIEIILVDDGSCDETAAICYALAESDSRIKVISKSNGGVSSARNCGIEQATGEWLCFVDADDWIDPEMLGWLLEKCKRNDADLAVCGLTQHFRNRIGTTESRIVDEPLMDAAAALGNVSIMQGRPVARLFKRNCISGVRFDTALHYGEDWLFFCEAITRSRRVYYEPVPFYHQLINREGDSRSCFDNSRTYFDAAVKVQTLYEGVSVSLGRQALIDVANAAASVSRWAGRVGALEEASFYRGEAIRYFKRTLNVAEVSVCEKAKCAIRIFTPDVMMSAFHRLAQ